MSTISANTQKQPATIIIDQCGDLTVRLYEASSSGEKIILSDGGRVIGGFLASYKILRQVLVNNSAYFKHSLAGNVGAARRSVVDIKDGTVVSLELWSRALHGTMTKEMYLIDVKEVWEAPEFGSSQGLQNAVLNDWFATWFEKEKAALKLDDMRKLLYPCKEFDYAKGFAFLTKSLAYEAAEYIYENNPTVHFRHHLEHNEIGKRLPKPEALFEAYRVSQVV